MEYITVMYASREYQIKVNNLSVENLCNLFGIKHISHIMIPFENIPLFPNKDGSWSIEEIKLGKLYEVFPKSKYRCLWEYDILCAFVVIFLFRSRNGYFTTHKFSFTTTILKCSELEFILIQVCNIFLMG